MKQVNLKSALLTLSVILITLLKGYSIGLKTQVAEKEISPIGVSFTLLHTFWASSMVPILVLKKQFYCDCQFPNDFSKLISSVKTRFPFSLPGFAFDNYERLLRIQFLLVIITVMQ